MTQPRLNKPLPSTWRGDAIDIAIDLHIGTGTARVWTCDMTEDYIAINADYRNRS